MVVQLGGLLGRPADQPDVDERVGVEAPVPAAFGIEDDVVGAGADLRGDAAGERGEVGEPQRRGSRTDRDACGTGRGACSSTGGLRGWSADERTRKSQLGRQHWSKWWARRVPQISPRIAACTRVMGPQLELRVPNPSQRSNTCPRCPDIASVDRARGARATPAGRASGCSRSGLVVDLVPEPVVPADGQVVRADRRRQRPAARPERRSGPRCRAAPAAAAAARAPGRGSSVICSAKGERQRDRRVCPGGRGRPPGSRRRRPRRG